MTGNPAITWWNGMGLYDPPVFGFPAESGAQGSGPRTFRAGQKAAEKLNVFPLHPGGYGFGGAYGLNIPLATRAGDILRLDVIPFSDSSGDTGEGFFNDDKYPITGSYQIDQNGRRLATGHGVFGPGRRVPRWMIDNSWTVRISPKPSVITFTLAAARAKTRYPLSTSATTTWTWRSAPVTGRRLPAGWVCTPLPNAARNCAMQPMMTLGYRVARLALNEAAPPGRQALAVTVGHGPLAHAAPITSAAVQVSFNGGRTWQGTALSGRAGHYTATYTAAAGRDVTLRVSAADAAGGRITETITRAYRIA